MDILVQRACDDGYGRVSVVAVTCCLFLSYHRLGPPRPVVDCHPDSVVCFPAVDPGSGVVRVQPPKSGVHWAAWTALDPSTRGSMTPPKSLALVTLAPSPEARVSCAPNSTDWHGAVEDPTPFRPGVCLGPRGHDTSVFDADTGFRRRVLAPASD